MSFSDNVMGETSRILTAQVFVKVCVWCVCVCVCVCT
jgi:hypothetical protein